MTDDLGKVGLVARFKPVHNGHATMIESICERADEVIIGIGSANKYNARNPFTPEESEDMINLVLDPFDNYQIIKVPDFAHIPEYADGQKWKQYIKENFGSLDYFISADKYVVELLGDDYQFIHPAEIVPRERWNRAKGSLVRTEMAQGGDYRQLVPGVVADYMEKNGLVQRFVQEFGLETIAKLGDPDYNPTHPEDAVSEKLHTMEI